MTFETRERSRQGGSPITLILIRYGTTANAFYALSNTESPVTFNNIEYTPVAGLEHSQVRRLLTLDNQRLTMTLPASHPLGNLWRHHPPLHIVSITIFQGHRGESDLQVAWFGRILGHADLRQESLQEFTCEPRTTSQTRSGLTLNYQIACPHLLYSQGDGLCNANKAAATVSYPVVGKNGPRVYLGGTWVADVATHKDFVQGSFEWVTEDGRKDARMIMDVEAGGAVLLTAAPNTLIVGSNSDMVKGCNHGAYAPEGDCERIHNNTPNYGGQLYIPLENPFGVKNGFN